MVGIFSISKTNLVAELNIPSLPANYRAWARVLLEYSPVRYALVTDTVLNRNMLRDCYCSAYNSSVGNELAFTFRVNDREIRVTELDLNRILRFPENNFVPYPTSGQLTQFFASINYVNPNLQDSGERCKNHLPKEWNFFFHILMQCFSHQKSNTHSISQFSQFLAFGVANNCVINFGKLLLNQLLYVMGPLEDRNLQVYDVECCFPRFLQLILNDLTTEDEKLIYTGSVPSSTTKQRNRIAHNLNNNRNYGNNVPAQMTDFMRGCAVDMERDVPLGPQEDDQVPEQVQATPPIATPAMDTVLGEEEEMVQVIEEVQEIGDGDSVDQADSQKSYHSGSTQGSLDIFESSFYIDLQDLLPAEPFVAGNQGNESETQQILTHATKPNTTNILPLSSLLPLKRNFVSEREGEGTQTALPLTRSRLEEPEVSVSPSARASELVSIIEPPTLIGVAHQGAHTEEELTEIATSVAEPMQVDPVQVMPSQAIAGVTGPSMPHITGSNVISPPGGTFLAPNQEVSTTVNVVERQLLGNSSSDEPCRIFTAGTEDVVESKRVSETPTERMSDHNSPTPLRLSASASAERNTPSEPVSETPISQTTTLTVHTQSLSQRVSNLEATVREMRTEFHSNVTEIKNAQYNILHDFQGFKGDMTRFVTDLFENFKSQITQLSTPTDNTTKGEMIVREQEKESGAISGAVVGEKGKMMEREANISTSLGEQHQDIPLEARLNLEDGEVWEPSQTAQGDDMLDEYVNDAAYDFTEMDFVEVFDLLQADKSKLEKCKVARQTQEKMRREHFNHYRRQRPLVMLRTGRVSDEARSLLQKPELGLIQNEDEKLLEQLQDAHKNYPSINQFFNALKQTYQSIRITTNSSGWQIQIQFNNSATTMSSNFLKSRSLTVLYVMKIKVAKGSHVLNKLLIDMIEDQMSKADIEVHTTPYTVIYYKDRLVQSLCLEDERLGLYPLERLKYVEGLLRSQGLRTEKKWKAAERIFAYRLNVLSDLGMDLSVVKRSDPSNGSQPKEPIYTREEENWDFERVKELMNLRSTNPGEEVSYPEKPNFPIVYPDFDVIRETETMVLTSPPAIRYRNPKGKIVTVDIRTMSFMTSKELGSILDQIKTSTNYKDKSALAEISMIYNEVLGSESQYNTYRVKAVPKRLSVKGKTKILEFTFKQVKQIRRVAVLQTLQDALSFPKPRNMLEQEALDLVNDQLASLVQ